MERVRIRVSNNIVEEYCKKDRGKKENSIKR